MADIFLSEFLGLKDELERLGVFDAIITSDSCFFINILRLKQTSVFEFKKSYEKINNYFREMMTLLSHSEERNDRFYREALKRFSFSGIKEINIGFSSTGVDGGFGGVLSKQIISDAYDIVKAGSTDPEIFQLIGLFEERVGPDRLSDMIASLILDDIIEYTKNVNATLDINSETHPEISFDEQGIAWNPYKKCRLLYLPKDILHEMPVAYCWEDVGYVAAENDAIRNEFNQEISIVWKNLKKSDQKYQIKQILKDPEKCRRIIESYRNATIDSFDLKDNFDYNVQCAFLSMKRSGVLDCMWHSDCSVTSYEGTLRALTIFREFVENNKGWELIQEMPSKKREKYVQRLIQLAGQQYCEDSNLDMSFEPNEGPGPADLKISRGKDKTVVEIKLSSNKSSFHGYDVQIEDYAKAEKTDQKIFVYVEMDDNNLALRKIYGCQERKRSEGFNPPAVFVIDSKRKTSASKR